MTPTDDLFLRQARCQRSRRDLSWLEKIREAERLRPSLRAFRQKRANRRVRPARRLPDAAVAPAARGVSGDE